MTASAMAEPTIPAELEVLFQRRTQELQMLPAIAIQALEIARDPDCAISEFTAVVERDIKLASDILTMSNSVMFSPGRPISNLHQSVVRLGFRQCRNLILSTSMAALMKQITLQQEWIRDVLWRHSFLTAMLAVNINRAVGAGFHGEEFSAGLIHDLGRTLFAVCVPDAFTRIDPMEFLEDENLLMREEQVIGTNHCEVGGWFAIQQKLPAELVEVMRFHHDPGQSLNHRRLVSLISVCDHMANHLHRTGHTHTYDVRDNTAVFMLDGCGVRNAAGRLSEMAVEIMRAAERDSIELMGV